MMGALRCAFALFLAATAGKCAHMPIWLPVLHPLLIVYCGKSQNGLPWRFLHHRIMLELMPQNGSAVLDPRSGKFHLFIFF
jgi:hypothetical protein